MVLLLLLVITCRPALDLEPLLDRRDDRYEVGEEDALEQHGEAEDGHEAPRVGPRLQEPRPPAPDPAAVVLFVQFLGRWPRILFHRLNSCLLRLKCAVRWSNFDLRDPKMGVFLQSTEATPCGHLLE